MTPQDYRTALTTLGLDNHHAAQWLGVSVKSVRRYRVSGVKGPVAGMVRLGLVSKQALKALEAYQFTPQQILALNQLALALDWRE